MALKESSKFETLGQNTPIYQYPTLINKNFGNVETEISLFYNDKNKTFTDKKSNRFIIAPIYNEKVESNLGIFDDIVVDNLRVVENIVISNPNGQDVSLDSIVLKQNLNTENFIIDDKTGLISIRKTDEDSLKCPIEADSVGNVAIGVGAVTPLPTICVDNISIGDNFTLSNLGKVKKTKNVTDNNSYNIAIGAETLKNFQEGTGNIILGASSCTNMITGSGNIVIGTSICDNLDVCHDKLYIGNINTGIFIEGDMREGEFYLRNSKSSIKFDKDIKMISSSNSNIIIGSNEIMNLSYLSGGDNILIGTDISSTIMGGDKNIFIGSNSAYRLFDVANHTLCIGVVDEENGINDPIIFGDMKNAHLKFNSKVTEFGGDIKVANDFRTSGSGTAIGLDSNNNIVKFTSSRRYKTAIKRLKKDESSKIYNIECITYEPLNQDGSEHLGFIAEDVEKIDKRLVGYTNINGVETVDSVLYERFVVLLLNEVKKHEDTINDLQNKVQELSKNKC